MGKKKLDFTRGVIVDPDLVFVGALDGKRTKLIQWLDGEFTHFRIPWPTTSITASADPLVLYSMGPDGDIHVFGDDGGHRETVDGPERHGLLRAMCMIGGVNIAVGMQRQVVRRNADGSWESIAASILNTDGIRGFNTLAAYSPQEIYVAGLAGEVWRFDGQQWQRLDVPTSLALQHIVCADDGLVYIVGQAGLILAGRDTRWTVLDTGKQIGDLWGCAWFDGHLYVASSRGVYKWTGAVLSACDIGATQEGSASYLMAGHGMLWSIGQRHVAYSRDGAQWTAVTDQANAC
jgi:hypothetical protein